MRKLLVLIWAFMATACMSTPESVQFNGKTVGTYSVAAGCGTMKLDTDCSEMSGATRDIELDGTALRIAGGNNGQVVFIMSESMFSTDMKALRKASDKCEALFASKGIEVKDRKVMYGSGDIYGVHFTLSGDGYELLIPYSVED
ncbi:hypothetical protein L2725_03140 [Shewanella corallii]|uniref:Lipoprotein n=1 Tax=Shewanella corallii TaxID=560080 RepID=A0ABT0N4R3_9GAMM|nr:hypothetical protein [Shewanella corallii]MCL2912787.1 hypothetical protein [Shewanella corallii]